jgi:hypothetical protein
MASHEARAERHRLAAAQQAMDMMDLTGPDLIAHVDNVSDAVTQLAMFMASKSNQPWDVVSAQVTGYCAAALFRAGRILENGETL